MYSSVVFVLLVAYAAAQVPSACDSPPQFECRETLADRSQKFYETRKLIYDATNQRERKLEEVMEGATKNSYDVLTLYKENKEYILDLKTRKCNTTTPSHPFHHRGVVPGSHFDYEVTIGASGVTGESVVLKAFSLNTTTEAHFGTVTVPDCFPVQNIRFTKEYGMEESTYYDITVGIKDPNAFAKPTECTP